MNEEIPTQPPKIESEDTAFFSKAVKVREAAQQTEFRNWMVFLILFTLCLQTVRGKEINEPFYGICYSVAGFITGIAVNKAKDAIQGK